MIDGNIIEIQDISFEPKSEHYLENPHDAGLAVVLKMTDTKTDSIFIEEAAIGLDGALMYNYPAAIDALGLRIKLEESTLDDYFTPDNLLSYKEIVLKMGTSYQLDGFKLSLSDFDKAPKHRNYDAKEGDIAIGAILNIEGNGIKETANPIYIIRDNQPMSIKYYNPTTGFHVRFSNIDPAKEEFTFKISRDIRENKAVKIAVARDVPRSDYLILMAVIFPGINLFWLGGILMMVGLFMASWARFRSKLA
jgi:cytochrome c-type biogenesis protein CcmF